MDQDLIHIRDHVAILRRRWRLIALCLVLGLAGGLGLALAETPVYKGSAKLLLQPQTLETTTSGTIMSPEEVATQADVIVSVKVADRVIEQLGLERTSSELIKDVTVEVVETKRVVLISALDSSPERAADVANAFARQYIEYRSEVALESITLATESYNQQLTEIRGELRTLREAIRASDDARLPALQAEEQALVGREAQLATELMTMTSAQAAPQPAGEVLLRAEPPRRPAEPKPVRAAALGAILGLLVGIGGAYVRDRLDDGIRDESRLRTALGGRPILGQLPVSADQQKGRVATLLHPHSPLSEAFRSLNTNVRFLLAAGRDGSTERGEILLVTSAAPGEGKTSVSTNLAVAAAKMGLNVVLVDADLRRPQVASRFGVDIPVGLSDILAEGDSVFAHLHEVGTDNLRILAAGSIPPNPAELLGSPSVASIFDELATEADLVIVDSAPVLGVADSLELVRSVDLMILVAQHRTSRLHNVQAAAEKIRQVGGTLAGGVLNSVTARDSAYGYGYPSAADKSARKGRRANRDSRTAGVDHQDHDRRSSLMS